MAQFVMTEACIVFLGQGRSDGAWEVIPAASCIQTVGGLQGVAGQGCASSSPSQSLSRDRAAGEWPWKAQPRNQACPWGRIEGWMGCWLGAS